MDSSCSLNAAGGPAVATVAGALAAAGTGPLPGLEKSLDKALRQVFGGAEAGAGGGDGWGASSLRGSESPKPPRMEPVEAVVCVVTVAKSAARELAVDALPSSPSSSTAEPSITLETALRPERRRSGPMPTASGATPPPPRLEAAVSPPSRRVARPAMWSQL